MQLVYHQPPSENDLQPAGMDNLTSALDESMDPEKEDYEVFDKRDLMNVVVHSVLCAGIYNLTSLLQECTLEEFFKFRKNTILCAKLVYLETIKFVSDSSFTCHEKWRNFVCKKSAKCSRPEIREF
jgi:hypothetical protein